MLKSWESLLLSSIQKNLDRNERMWYSKLKDNPFKPGPVRPEKEQNA
jgi:hypothetical protein